MTLSKYIDQWTHTSAQIIFHSHSYTPSETSAHKLQQLSLSADKGRVKKPVAISFLNNNVAGKYSNNWVPPWIRNLLEKVITAKTDKKFAAFQNHYRCITASTRIRHWSLSQQTESRPHFYFIIIHFNIISPSMTSYRKRKIVKSNFLTLWQAECRVRDEALNSNTEDVDCAPEGAVIDEYGSLLEWLSVREKRIKSERNQLQCQFIHH
jgi:hypothetical protein